jgi:hypothetical protein
MKIIITILFASWITTLNAMAATVQLTLNTRVNFNFDNTPLLVGSEAVIKLIYDTEQQENPEVMSGDPDRDARLAATSIYTVEDGMVSLEILGFKWSATSYQIALANDVPVLTPQDYFRINFTSLVPANFAALGYGEATNSFDLYLQDSGTLSLLSKTTLPSTQSEFLLTAVTQAEGSIHSDSRPRTWNNILGPVTSFQIATIPEPSTSMVLALAIVSFTLRRKR